MFKTPFFGFTNLIKYKPVLFQQLVSKSRYLKTYIKKNYPDIYSAHFDTQSKLRVDKLINLSRVGQDTVKAFEKPLDAVLDFENVSSLWDNLTNIIKSSPYYSSLITLHVTVNKKSDVWINLIDLADDLMSYCFLYPASSVKAKRAHELFEIIMQSKLLSEQQKENFSFLVVKMYDFHLDVQNRINLNEPKDKFEVGQDILQIHKEAFRQACLDNEVFLLTPNRLNAVPFLKPVIKRQIIKYYTKSVIAGFSFGSKVVLGQAVGPLKEITQTVTSGFLAKTALLTLGLDSVDDFVSAGSEMPSMTSKVQLPDSDLGRFEDPLGETESNGSTESEEAVRRSNENIAAYEERKMKRLQEEQYRAKQEAQKISDTGIYNRSEKMLAKPVYSDVPTVDSGILAPPLGPVQPSSPDSSTSDSSPPDSSASPKSPGNQDPSISKTVDSGKRKYPPAGRGYN